VVAPQGLQPIPLMLSDLLSFVHCMRFENFEISTSIQAVSSSSQLTIPAVNSLFLSSMFSSHCQQSLPVVIKADDDEGGHMGKIILTFYSNVHSVPQRKNKEIDKKRVLLVNPVQNKLCWKIIFFENFTHYDP